MKERRTCKCCGQTKFISEFYTNGLYYDTTCKACVSFTKKCKKYKDRMDPDDYNQWYEENSPKKIIINPYDEEEIKKGYKYRSLSEAPYNCYVKRLDFKEISILEKLLKSKIQYKETSDKDGYVLEAKNER